MILQFDDGRELTLPDEMTDESARQLKRLIQAHEERTKAAESTARILQDEMAAVRRHVDGINMAAADNTAMLTAIRELRTAIMSGLQQVHSAASADRMIVMDEFGEYTRSRIVK